MSYNLSIGDVVTLQSDDRRYNFLVRAWFFPFIINHSPLWIKNNELVTIIEADISLKYIKILHSNGILFIDWVDIRFTSKIS